MKQRYTEISKLQIGRKNKTKTIIKVQYIKYLIYYSTYIGTLKYIFFPFVQNAKIIIFFYVLSSRYNAHNIILICENNF